MTRTRTRRRITTFLELAGSALAAVLVLAPSVAAVGPLPALGAALGPGTGIWRLSPDATAATAESDQITGLAKPATVTFEANGLAHVTAADDADLWRVIGYTHARFRLTEMDLQRRRAEGELAAILGPSQLESDGFELDLGLRRAAERDWAAMPAGDPARAVLQAYADGVNSAIDQLEADGRLPTLFKILGYRPARWTPVDSLVIQRLMTQTLAFTDQSATYSYAAGALPAKTFDDWFPVIGANPQYPFDTGPYRTLPLAPLPVGTDPADRADPPAAGTAAPAPAPTGTPTALGPLTARLAALPPGSVHEFEGSNAWVVAGARTKSGHPILATDPHLEYTLPSVWYQLSAVSPGYAFTGATLPGVPVPLIGKTGTFSWGITNSLHPVTLYYLESTDAAHPDQYYWNGAWRRDQAIDYRIQVKGQGTVTHRVRLTVHGPILQMQGLTVATWWAGTLPSANVDSILTMLRATDFAGFRDALRGWATPAVNFVYADAQHIGVANAGVAPQVPGHNIALPLPGDGTADVTGSIPVDALPTAYDPPSGFIVVANQRETTGAYPYEFSTSYNLPDLGWRTEELVRKLSAARGLTVTDMQKLQTDMVDDLAVVLMPHLLDALRADSLSPLEAELVSMLRTWDDASSPDQIPPRFFETFQNELTWTVFEPWWTYYGSPQDPGEALRPPSADQGSLANQVLRSTMSAWVVGDPGNAWFTAPGGPHRTATDVLRQAFHATVAFLTKKWGPDLAAWRYDRHHFVLFRSILDIPALDVGPYRWGGTGRAVNATLGSLYRDGQPVLTTSTAGPSWRFVVDWGTGQAASVYPGGQSENLLSPWYATGIPLWLDGREWPVLEGDAAARAATAEWRLSS